MTLVRVQGDPIPYVLVDGGCWCGRKGKHLHALIRKDPPQ